MAPSDRRERSPAIDAHLDEWLPADLLQNGPLIRMFDRPSVQHLRIAAASTPSKIYSAWGENEFYVAFEVGGLAGSGKSLKRNFIDFQSAAAPGSEDLCEILLVQPVYLNNTLGPATYLACKPKTAFAL